MSSKSSRPWCSKVRYITKHQLKHFHRACHYVKLLLLPRSIKDILEGMDTKRFCKQQSMRSSCSNDELDLAFCAFWRCIWFRCHQKRCEAPCLGGINENQQASPFLLFPISSLSSLLQKILSCVLQVAWTLYTDQSHQSHETVFSRWFSYYCVGKQGKRNGVWHHGPQAVPQRPAHPNLWLKWKEAAGEEEEWGRPVKDIP